MIRSQAAYESVVIDILAVSGNSFILLGVLIILVFAVAYALFTIKGSGISRTPSAKGAGTAGAVGPSEKSGVDQGQGSATGSDIHGSSDPQNGTK